MRANFDTVEYERAKLLREGEPCESGGSLAGTRLFVQGKAVRVVRLPIPGKPASIYPGTDGDPSDVTGGVDARHRRHTNVPAPCGQPRPPGRTPRGMEEKGTPLRLQRAAQDDAIARPRGHLQR